MYERELERKHADRDDFTTEPPTPGRASASATLIRREQPSASGILMRKARDANGVGADAEASVAAASGGSGSALPMPLQRKFEASLGADLSGVRVHTGGESQAAASAVGAKAYTMGQDIHFGAGHYDPSSRAGEHLLAHEVAHTVQQSGGTARRQHKLEVSGPQDAAELEADRAADAMVSGAAFSVSGASTTVARKEEVDKLETKELANEGQQETIEEAEKTDAVFQASNSADLSDAQKALALLEKNQPMLEKGARMVSPHQKGPADALHDMMRGKGSGMVMQIPMRAIGENASLITDLQAYLAEGSSHGVATSEFKDHYKVLMGQFGRVESIASKYAGTSLKTMKAEDAGAVVEDAAGVSGHTTKELNSTFKDLMKDKNVAVAASKVEESTKALEAMPALVTDSTATMISTQKTFSQAIDTTTTANAGLRSLTLRNKFQAAKAKGNDAKVQSDAAMDLITSGGKAAAEGAKQAILEIGSPTQLSKWAGVAAAGATSGGAALQAAAFEKFIAAPAEKLFKKAMADADAAYGIISEEVQLEADIDAEQAKQDSATHEAAKKAGATLKTATTAAHGAMLSFAKTAVDFDVKKLQVAASFRAFKDAILKASKASGKGSEGKALAEIATFMEESEQFLVQANLVLDLAARTMGGGDQKNLDTKAKAREALTRINSRVAWIASPYKFKGAKGVEEEYYNAQQVMLNIAKPGMDATDEERRGKGRADGFTDDDNLAANDAVEGVIPKVEGMRAKVNAVRNKLMTEVFGK